jgi:hypothetical protein
MVTFRFESRVIRAQAAVQLSAGVLGDPLATKPKVVLAAAARVPL